MPKLVIFRGDAVENETRLAGRPVRLGRDNRNDIVLDDKSVSRFHAEVRPEGDKYFIVDLKSRNGVWVNGQQVKGKTPLALGAPVTLGAFEVTLEDDVGTGEFDEHSPLLAPRTMVSVPSTMTEQTGGASRSATRAAMKAPAATTKNQVVLWSAAAAAVVILCGVTFAVIRYRRPVTPVEVAVPPPVPPTPTMPTVVAVEPPADDPTKSTIDRHLADGQASLAKGDYAAVRAHVARVLELDAGNQAALDLKRQADAAAAAPRGRTSVVTVVTPPPPPPTNPEVETPGIPRRPGESWTDYTNRAQAIKGNLDAGKAYVDKKEFALGIARYRAVSAAQKGYQGVEALITDAETRQRTAFEQSMKYGQDSEKQTPPRWSDALRWYQDAQRIDPNATAPRERIGPLTERVTKEGTEAFNRGEVFRKRGDNAKALEAYKLAADLLPANNEKRAEALKWLETLKP